MKDKEVQIVLEENEINDLKANIQELHGVIENNKKEIEKVGSEKKELVKKIENLENNLIKTKSNLKSTKSLQEQAINELKLKLDKAQRTIETNETSLAEYKKAKKQIADLKNTITKTEESEKKIKFMLTEKELKHEENTKELNKKIASEHKKYVQLNDEFKQQKEEFEKKINTLQEEIKKKDEEIQSLQKIIDDSKKLNEISKVINPNNIQNDKSLLDIHENSDFDQVRGLMDSNQNSVIKECLEKTNQRYHQESIKKTYNKSHFANQNANNNNDKGTDKKSSRRGRKEYSKVGSRDIKDQNFVNNPGIPPPRKELSPKEAESFSKEISEGPNSKIDQDVKSSQSIKNLNLNLCDVSVCSNLQFYEKVLRSELKQLRELSK